MKRILMLEAKFGVAVLVAVAAVAIVGSVFFTVAWGDSSFVGLTYRTITSPCEARAGSCLRPDPKGVVAEFMLPDSLWVDARKERYEVKINLNLFVGPSVVSPFPKDINLRELRHKNYLRGDSRTATIYAWKKDESFGEFLRERGLRFASPHGFEYSEYKDVIDGYSLFDAEICANLTVDELDLSGGSLKQGHPCLVSKVIKVPKNYDWAFASCIRDYKGKLGRAKLSGCTIHSRIAPGVYIEYVTDSGNVDSDYWIGIDKRIREYVLSLRLESNSLSL